MSSKFIKLFFSLFILSNNIISKIIIWDLGGVLCDPDKFGVARDIGLGKFISYMLHDRKNPNIQVLLFKTLATMDVEKRKDFKYAETAEGMTLPDVMCHWQAGTIKGPDIIKMANIHFKKLDNKNYFYSNREKILLKKTINNMFNPKILAKNIVPLKDGLDLLKACYKVKNNDGSRKHKLIAFSNWDPLSFDIFYKKNRKMFKYFDDIIISGKIQLIKPNPKSFKYLIEELNLDPRDCILIDDQKVNTQGAQKCHIKTIQVKHYNFKKIRNKLLELGVI